MTLGRLAYILKYILIQALDFSNNAFHKFPCPTPTSNSVAADLTANTAFVVVKSKQSIKTIWNQTAVHTIHLFAMPCVLVEEEAA